MAKISIQEFGEKLKAKYPQYGNFTAAEIGLKALEKYPVYRDRVEMPRQSVTPTGLGGNLSSLLSGEQFTNAPSSVGFAPEETGPAAQALNVARGGTKPGLDLGTALKNIPASGKEFLSGIYQAVRHPAQTVEGLASIAVGAVQKLVPGKQAQEVNFDAVTSFFKERYGGIENIKKTIEQDPVGFLSDLSAVVSGAGLALKTAGTVFKVSSLSKAGQVATKVGLAVEPTTAVVKGLNIVTKPLQIATKAVVGGGLAVSTGKGLTNIAEAFRNPTPEFRQAMRGKITSNDILSNAREGLYAIKDERGAAYRSQLEKIKGATETLDTASFNSFIDQKLKEFNITRDAKGNLDFSKSVVADKAEAKRISDFIKETRNWSDNTPAGLDILKQRLDDFYTTSGKGRALTNSLRSNLDSFLDKNVEGYSKLTTDYRRATGLITEIEKTLSLGPNTTADTTLRKLTSAMKEDNQMRLALVKEIDTRTGGNLTSMISGQAFSSILPSGLIGRSIFAGSIGLTAGLTSPSFLGALAVSSPRVVGEFLNAIGMTRQAALKAAEVLTSSQAKTAYLASFQAGRAEINQEAETGQTPPK